MKSLTLTSTDEAYDESLPGFLLEHKMPVDSEGEPTISVAQHLKNEFAAWYFRESINGLKKIAAKTVTLDKVFE